MQLEPCPACKRHVRTDERVCPFCAAEIGATMARAPRRRLPGERLGRAALMSFSLTAGAAALAGCDDDGPSDESIGTPLYGAPVQPDPGGPMDAGQVDARVQDARAEDARAPDASADASRPDATVDAGRDAGPQVVPLYGGPVPVYGAPAQRPKP